MEHQLSYLNDAQRLKAYNTIVDGCHHLWSKGKLQESRLNTVLDTFVNLAEQDPYFLAHFTSYAIKKLPSKDLKVVATFANSLSDADGTPFVAGSTYKKPNLRTVSQAAIQELDPKLVERVISLANLKKEMGKRPKATHFSNSLKKAITKYLKYRENNPKAIEGIKKSGLARRYKNLYRNLHLSPSTETAEILGWPQKDGREINVKKDTFDFSGLSDLKIAEKIRNNKLRPTGVLGALPKKISPVVAAAILEQATGDQAVILSNLFEEQGLLKNKEVKTVFNEKIKTAKTALDRVDRFQKELDQGIQNILKTAKSEKRKEDVGDIGKIFLHIDISSSMHEALELAKESGATIAECVKNPQENFYWGVFNEKGYRLRTPPSFEKGAFASMLYSIRPGGCTDCLALYKEARRLGCDVDVYITDQDHNGKNLDVIIRESEKEGFPKPKAVVLITVGRWKTDTLRIAFERNGIPVTEMKASSLKESALVAQAVKTAMLGANAVLEEIMSEPLLTLPKWWFTIKDKKKNKK